MSKHNLILVTTGCDPYDHDRAISTEVWSGSWCGMGMACPTGAADALTHFREQIRKQAIGWVTITEITADTHIPIKEYLRLTAELRKRIEVNVAAKSAKKGVKKPGGVTISPASAMDEANLWATLDSFTNPMPTPLGWQTQPQTAAAPE